MPASRFKKLSYKSPATEKMVSNNDIAIRINDCSRFSVNSKHLKNECKKYNPVIIPNGYDLDSFFVEESKDAIRENGASVQLDKSTELIHIGNVPTTRILKNINLITRK